MALTYAKAPTQFKNPEDIRGRVHVTSTSHGNCDAYQKVFEDVFNLQKMYSYFLPRIPQKPSNNHPFPALHKRN